MKRFVAAFLVLLTLLTSVPTAFATEGNPLVMQLALESVNGESAENAEVKTGDKVIFSANIEQNPGIATLILEPVYDKTKLQPVTGTRWDDEQEEEVNYYGITGNRDWSPDLWTEEVCAGWVNQKNNKKTGTFATFEFTVLAGEGEDVKFGVRLYNDDPDNCMNKNNEAVALATITPCTITVAGGGENPNVPVTGVTLDKTTLELTEGQEEQLTATVVPETATTRTVKWTSDSEQVTVDENGKVKALYYTAGSTGKATITVTTDDGKYTATCEVTVKHADMQKVGEQPASCTGAGQKAHWFCDRCGLYYLIGDNDTVGEETTADKVIIPASPHTLEPVAEKAATCTTGGNVAYWKCSVCGAMFKDANGSEPTNEESVKTPANGHSYSSEWSKDENNHWHECTVCHEKEPDTEKPHDWKVVVKKDYAEDSKQHEVQCSECGAFKNEDHEGDDITTAWERDKDNHWHVYGCGTIMNKSAHDWDGGVVTRQPTCTREGEKTYTCGTCGETKTEAVAKAPHTLQKTDAKAATCTEDGNNEYYVCSRCNGVFKDALGETATTVKNEALTALGHDFGGAWISDGEDGHYQLCQRAGCDAKSDLEPHRFDPKAPCDEAANCLDGCGYVRPAGSHTWGKPEYKWTETEDSYTCTGTVVCDTCGDIEHGTATVNTTFRIAPTCTVDGTVTYTATFTTEPFNQLPAPEKTLTLTALGHDFGGAWISDGEDGHYQLCQRAGCDAKSDLEPHRFDPKAPCDETASCLDGCGYVRPAGSHTWGKPDYKWTKTEDGYTCTGKAVCDKCGDNESETATVTDAVTTQPTCTQPGVKTFTATFIKAPFETQTTTEPVTTLAPHTMVKTEDKAATCVAAGNNAYWTCSVCKGVFKDELGKTATTVEAETLPIDPANHTGNTELRDAVTATCNMSGHEADTYCKDCGVLLSRGATIPATGKHTYGEDGRCTSCGNVNPTAGVNTDDIKAADTVNGKPVSPDNSGKVIASDDGKTVIKTPAAADDNTVQQVKDALTGGSVTLYVDNRKTEALTGSDGGVAALEALAASASGERKQELEKLAEALKALLSDSGRKNAAGQMVYDGEMQLCDANGVPVAELVQSPNSIQVTLPITEAQYQAMQGKKVCVLRSSTDASGAAAVTELSATVGGSQGARVLSFSTDKGGALALTVYETVSSGSSGGSSGGSGSSTAPRTADAGVTVWCALLGISALLGTALVAKKRRQA